MVVRLQAFDYEQEHLAWASFGKSLEPPVPSQLNQRGSTPRAPPKTSVALFRRALQSCLESAGPLEAYDLTGSWLSALIYMDACICAHSLDKLVSQWRDAPKALNSDELQDLLQLAKQSCNSLQTSVNQVAAFRKSYPAARRSDYDEAYHFLGRLLGEATPIAEEIKDLLETQHQMKTYEVSTLAVTESKSAIARELRIRT